MSLRYNTGEGENNQFPVGTTECMESAHSPMSVWVFSGYSGILSYPKDINVRFTGVSKLSRSE